LHPSKTLLELDADSVVETSEFSLRVFGSAAPARHHPICVVNCRRCAVRIGVRRGPERTVMARLSRHHRTRAPGLSLRRRICLESPKGSGASATAPTVSTWGKRSTAFRGELFDHDYMGVVDAVQQAWVCRRGAAGARGRGQHRATGHLTSRTSERVVPTRRRMRAPTTIPMAAITRPSARRQDGCGRRSDPARPQPR
jgi:hypothetical protein